MTIQFCASGWQNRTKELVTTNKRCRNRPWKTLQRSFWSMWTNRKLAFAGDSAAQVSDQCEAGPQPDCASRTSSVLVETSSASSRSISVAGPAGFEQKLSGHFIIPVGRLVGAMPFRREDIPEKDPRPVALQQPQNCPKPDD
jgi:hypothetical protein